MNKKNNIADLLKNHSFLKWLKKEKGSETAQWDAWQKAAPENEQLVEDAKLILKGMPFQKRKVNSAKRNANWDKLAKQLPPVQSIAKTTQFAPARSNWLKIAAAISFLAVCFWAIFLNQDKNTLVEHRTQFGETKTIQLPCLLYTSPSPRD